MTGRPRRVPERIEDLLEAVGHIESDIGDLDEAAFLDDGKTQRAVIESLIVIGEAAHKLLQLDPGIERSAPALWHHFRDAYDMRIILTHEYFRVDAAVVWTTVRKHLPDLKAQLIAFKAGRAAS